MTAEATRDLLQGPVGSAVVRQGLPVAIAMAAQAGFNLVDLAMVGRLGSDVVAGVHCAATINFLPMIVGNAISVATLSMMSRLLGAGDREAAGALSSWSQFGMLVFGVLLGTLGAVLAAPSIDLQGVEGGVRDVAIDYLVVSNAGAVTMFALMQVTASMRAVGQAVQPALLVVGANVLNVLLNLVFIFGWDAIRFPALGALGAAYATVLARGIFAAFGLWLLRRRSDPVRLRWTGLRAPTPSTLREIWSLGVPGGLQMVLRTCAVIVLTRLTYDAAGNDAVSAVGIATRLDTVVLLSAIGYAGAATTIAGHAVGAGDPDRARATCRHAGLQAFAFGIVVVTCFWTFAAELVRIFVPDADDAVVQFGVLYLGSAALAQPFAALCLAITGGVHGAGRMVRPLVIDGIGFGLGGAFALTVALDWSVAGLWWLFVAINALLAVAHWLHGEFGAWTVSARQDGSPGRVLD